MMKGSTLRWSLGDIQSSALKWPDAVSPRGTCAAILHGRSETSKLWMERMPDSPLIRRSQLGLTPQPRGVTMPIPVTTTRFMATLGSLLSGTPRGVGWGAARETALSDVLLDELDRVLDGD